MKAKILWIDDEINSLNSLVYFLSSEGYDVHTATNGDDALYMIKNENYDIVLLDQYMTGLNGIETLNLIKEIDFNLPVIMISKSEDNDVIDSALGEMVDDYLIKPVNPRQLSASIKKLLRKRQNILQNIGKNYSQTIQRINKMLENPCYENFYRINHMLSLWNLRINRNIQTDILKMHDLQKQQINYEFFQFIKNTYTEWIKGKDAPVMSNTFLDNYVLPLLKEKKKVFFLLIDCLRYDHYLLMETFLKEVFKLTNDYYYSIIPAATPYSRNSIFAGLTPHQIHKIYPDRWTFFDTESQNQHEEFFLRKKISNDIKSDSLNYSKILTNEALQRYFADFSKISDKMLNVLIVNIMDVFTHFRSESEILKDMLPDENSLLAFVSTWFRTSNLMDFLRELLNKDYTIIITSDHGSIISKKPMLIETGKDVSVNLKYKFGSSIKTKDNDVLVINNPVEYALPISKDSDKWYITSGNGYFVYSTKYSYYKKQYYNTFQHGGISMEEMILPVGIINGVKL